MADQHGDEDHRDEDNAAIDARLNAAASASRDGAHAEALAICQSLFAQGHRTGPLYDRAAQAVTAALLDDVDAASTVSHHDALLRIMILQPERFGTAPAFHHAISATHTPGNAEALARIAQALKPVLSALWEEGCRSRPLLLMVLLLREKLHPWQPEAEISAWHLDLLPDFDITDMAVPYNMMFDRETFARNIADIRTLMDGLRTAELAAQFSTWKLFFFHCLTRSARLDRDLLALIAAYDQAAGTDRATADDEAGQRSLALRAIASGKPAPSVGRWGEGFANLAADWAERRVPVSTANVAGALSRLGSKRWQTVHGGRNLVAARLPFLKLPGRKPRIAICISGQLRGYRRAYPSWLKGLLREVDHQIVVHSWTRIGRSGAEPFRAFLPFAGEQFCVAYRTHAGRAGMAETMARYPSLFAALNDAGEVSEGSLGAFYETDHVVLEDDRDSRFDGWPNSNKMHYKLAAANALSRKLGDDFDLVLRVRPDKHLGVAAFAWRDLMTAARGSATIFADADLGFQYGFPMIGDQVAIGSRAAMDIYAETFHLMPKLAQQNAFACSSQLIGHVSLAATCWHAGVDVRRLPVQMGALLEADPLDERVIEACLQADAAGRMDHMDRALLEAIKADLAAGPPTG